MFIFAVESNFGRQCKDNWKHLFSHLQKKEKGNKMGFLLEDILSKNNLIEDGTFVSTTGYFGVKIL